MKMVIVVVWAAMKTEQENDMLIAQITYIVGWEPEGRYCSAKSMAFKISCNSYADFKNECVNIYATVQYQFLNLWKLPSTPTMYWEKKSCEVRTDM